MRVEMKHEEIKNKVDDMEEKLSFKTKYKFERVNEITDLLMRIADQLDGADTIDLCVIKAAITGLSDELIMLSTEPMNVVNVFNQSELKSLLIGSMVMYKGEQYKIEYITVDDNGLNYSIGREAEEGDCFYVHCGVRHHQLTVI